MTRKLLTLIAFVLLFCLLTGGCAPAASSSPSAPTSSSAAPVVSSAVSSQTAPVAERPVIRIASLKGPTTMGMVKLISDSEEKKTVNDYDVTMAGTADEIVAMIANKTVDAAAVPCNLAAVLYQKTKGAIQTAAINTLGVLYVVENGDTVQSVADLKGKTVYSTGKGTTPEYALNFILAQNGLDPQKDLTVEFKSEATEVASLLSEGKDLVAVLPQPFVTTVMAKNPGLRIALDFTQEWDSATDSQSALVTGVLIVRKEFLTENKVAFDAYLDEYRASTQYVNANPGDAAALVVKYGIIGNAEIAKKAIPQCNITFLEGSELITKAGGYLKALYEQNPASVGGALPDENFYYQR